MTTPQTSSHLSEDLAVRAYAAMMNTGSAAHIEPLLADDFRYASQWVFKEMVGKQAYLDYITAKLETVRKSGDPIWAEVGYLDASHQRPCVVLAAGDADNLVAVVLIKTQGSSIQRMDMCAVPSPHSVERTGKYPGCDK